MSAEQLIGKSVELKLVNDSKEKRTFRYSLKGLMLIAEKYSELGELTKLIADSVKQKGFSLETLQALVTLVHAGLIKDDPSLTEEQVMNLLDDNMDVICVAIMSLMEPSKPGEEGEAAQEGKTTFS